jgi:hypothetical protein
MKTQHVFSASAAAVLVVSMAAFAQTPQSASPSKQPDQQSTTQASRQPETPVTLVGCVMRETDYRKATDSGKGGPVGTGLGRGEEFVLVNAKKTSSGASAAAPADCSSATPTGEAYELSGSREKDLAQYVGRAVEIRGTMKAAKTETAPAGEPKPTGGFDPLKQDLKLFEVDVASFQPLPAGQSAAANPPAAQAPSPAPPAAPAAQPAPAPQPAPATPPSQPSAAAAPRQNLPRTASPLPATALFGLLSMATGLMLRRRG